MKPILAQFNRYPFFLFRTYSKEAKLDLEKMEIHTVIEDQAYNNETKQMETVAINRMSRLDPVALWQVILMKYAPIAFMIMLSNMPNSRIEATVAVISIISFSLFAYLWHLYTTLSKFVFFGMIILVYVLHFKFNVNALYIHWYLGYMLTSFLAYYVIFDVYHKRYKDYYLMVDIGGIKRIQIATRKPRPLILIPFMSKFTQNKREGIFYVNQGFNLGINVFLKGYFMRIVKEIEENNDDKDN